jgi:hypothetical protein
MIRVAIIDDHPLYRHGLAMAVEQAEDFTLMADAASIEDFDRLNMTADLVLLDLHLPGIEGAEGCKHHSAVAHIEVELDAGPCGDPGQSRQHRQADDRTLARHFGLRVTAAPGDDRIADGARMRVPELRAECLQLLCRVQDGRCPGPGRPRHRAAWPSPGRTWRAGNLGPGRAG